VDPFGQSLLGSEPVEQRDELPALGGLEAATELLLVLMGPAFVGGQAAEHHDLARVKAKGRQPRLPAARRVVAELGEQEGDPGDTELLDWWGGGLAPLRLSDLYGRAVIAPAAALTLLTGLVRVEQIDVGYGTFWVAWGITAIVLSLALGATLIRVTNAELRRIAADAPADDQHWPTLQRRATILFAINLLLLLSAVWAMEFKPTL
jgi:hypothetical protein